MLPNSFAYKIKYRKEKGGRGVDVTKMLYHAMFSQPSNKHAPVGDINLLLPCTVAYVIKYYEGGGVNIKALRIKQCIGSQETKVRR